MVAINPASGEIIIPVVLTGEDRGVSRTMGRVNQEFREFYLNANRAVLPTRVFSRDAWSLAYSLGRLGITLGLQTNPAFKAFHSTLIATAAVLRIITVVQHLSMLMSHYATATQTAATAQASLATWMGATTTAAATQTGVMAALNAVLSSTAFWATVISGGLLLATGLIAWSAIEARKASVPSMQHGGFVPNTGLYYLHAGETVVPASSNYSWINIDMKTGPVSSNIDVDNMLDMMGSRVASESRRRTGY